MSRFFWARLQSSGSGEVYPEAIAPALIAAGHFGGGMAKLFLDVTFVDLGRRGKASVKGMTGELEGAFDLAEIAANACGDCCPFH
jgi:hypothetical protein